MPLKNHIQPHLNIICCVILQLEPFVKKSAQVILDRIRLPIMLLVVIETLIANVDALLKAVVLRNHLSVPVTRLIVVAEVVHLLHLATRRDQRLVTLLMVPKASMLLGELHIGFTMNLVLLVSMVNCSFFLVLVSRLLNILWRRTSIIVFFVHNLYLLMLLAVFLRIRLHLHIHF